MVTVVILSLGVVGLFRAFLISLNYQQYLMTRLQVINFLSNNFAEAENRLLTGRNLGDKTSFFSGSVRLGDSSSQIGPVGTSEDETLTAGLNYLIVSHYLGNNSSQVFSRSSFIYVKE